MSASWIEDSARVLVVSGTRVIRCVVSTYGERDVMAYDMERPKGPYVCPLFPEHEGSCWCRGWYGGAANAFRVSVALALR